MSFRRSASLSFSSLIVYFAALSNAGSGYGGGGGGYGNYGYGYSKSKTSVQPVYIYRPMPLPSFTSYGPIYGFGQAFGNFVPGVFRPVFHDQYQAVKIGFDTNRSPIVTSHIRCAYHVKIGRYYPKLILFGILLDFFMQMFLDYRHPYTAIWARYR